jgi:WD40 repeat protein
VYGAYNYVVIVEREQKKVVAVLQGHGHKVTAIAASNTEEIAISGSKDRSAVAWSLERRCVLRKRTKLAAEVSAVCTLPSTPSTAFLALSNYSIVTWKWSEGSLLLDEGCMLMCAHVPHAPFGTGVQPRTSVAASHLLL